MRDSNLDERYLGSHHGFLNMLNLVIRLNYNRVQLQVLPYDVFEASRIFLGFL